jgi:DNA-binding MarR family transcriptional regulator
MFMKLGREYGHQKIKALGLTETEYTICTFLYYHNEVSQETIAETLLLDKTTVAKAIATIIKKGYILREQNPENRRKNIIKITEPGIQTVHNSVDIYDEWLNRVSAAFTENEIEQLDAFFEKLLSNALKIRDEDEISNN